MPTDRLGTMPRRSFLSGRPMPTLNLKVTTMAPKAPRSLSTIAHDIRVDWTKPNYAAKPYLEAMAELQTITDNYYYDSGRSVVLYFLSNASTWRGEKAKAIKAELKAMLKG